ncbi:MAG: hypothetical protein ACFE7E_06595 [Candidatus Hodarchaeota archaeon]
MDEKAVNIDDSWVLSRAGYFSNSFSNFLSKLSLKLPLVEKKLAEKKLKMSEKERKKLEEASKILGFESLGEMDVLDDLDVPSWVKPFTSWVKPFVSKIIDKVKREIPSRLKGIAGNLFGTGIFSLSSALYDVAKERGITHEGVLHLIRMLPEFEALMYFLNVRKFYRDHCAHQLRVAVLGDFLLDLKSDSGTLEGQIRDKLGLSSDEVRTAWWFTGLLHDTGYPLSKLCTAINWSLLNEILRCYPSLDIKIAPMFVGLGSGELRNWEYLSILADGMPNHWQERIKKGLGLSEPSIDTLLFEAGHHIDKEYQPESLQIDHGVVGAVNLLRTIGAPERLRKNLPEDRPFIEAARAISVHDFKDDLKEVPFEKYPLAFLLILADELQEWSRPIPAPIKDTYFTTSLEKITLLEAISYKKSDELWDIPYENTQAKKILSFDFNMLCMDKVKALEVLNCTEQYPESEIQLRDVKHEEDRKEEKYNILIRTR